MEGGHEHNQLLFKNIKTTLFARPSWSFLFLLFTALIIFSLQITRDNNVTTIFPSLMTHEPRISHRVDSLGPKTCSGLFKEARGDKVVTKSITEFGGVGDGKTSNTAAFRRAMEYMKRYAGKGGGSQLVVPKGKWLTGSFNLTSDLTLFLESGALILGSQDPEEWPIIEPLPSYGRGRERLGGRHISLIHGNSISNVVITGNNGTIDGQGKMWWDLWWNKTLNHTRGHLVELINSNNILISNLTFINSPFWTIHPVYSSNVVIRNMTILAPLNAPNTDGIDPDSSANICIEDCYIESGDDLVAIKSGWDQYGINTARPSANITVRRVSGTTPTCSGIGIGSEMSGGIQNILVEDLHVRDSAAGIRLKTDKGRGGYIANVTIRNVLMERVKVPIRFSRGANDHPDDDWDDKALPKVKGISISDVISLDSRKAPSLLGVEGVMYEDICMRNVSILGLSRSLIWNCEFISGYSDGVSPMPCKELERNINGSSSYSWCVFS